MGAATDRNAIRRTSPRSIVWRAPRRTANSSSKRFTRRFLLTARRLPTAWRLRVPCRDPVHPLARDSFHPSELLRARQEEERPAAWDSHVAFPGVGRPVARDPPVGFPGVVARPAARDVGFPEPGDSPAAESRWARPERLVGPVTAHCLGATGESHARQTSRDCPCKQAYPTVSGVLGSPSAL